jgi:histidyl-tRNA synthetase
LVVGPDEAAAGQVTVRDLVAHDQALVDRHKIVAHVQAKLAP